MWLRFSPQCCDAQVYLGIGRTCAESGTFWHPYYPLGVPFFFSIPYRLGLPPEFLILVNLAFMAASSYLGGRALSGLAVRGKPPPPSVAYAGSALGHLLFLWGDSWHSLTDVGAASLGLAGGWLSVLGLRGAERRFLVLAALSWALSLLLRGVYQYPALLAGASLAAALLVRGSAEQRKTAIAFGATLALPLLAQYYNTYAHTGKWAFLDPEISKKSYVYNMTVPVYGRDTVLPPSGGLFPRHYDAAACFRSPPDPVPPYFSTKAVFGSWSRDPYRYEAYEDGRNPILDALRAGDWYAPVCLWLRREWFYFGSRAPSSYVTDASQRVFSAWILAAHLAALGLAAWFFRYSERREAWIPAALFALGSWGLNSLVGAESRYMMVFQTFVWTVGLTALLHELRRASGPVPPRPHARARSGSPGTAPPP